MDTTLLIAVLVAQIVVVYLLVRRGNRGGLGEELRRSREESAHNARELREEVSGGLKATHDTTVTTMREMATFQRERLEGMARELRDLTDSSEKRIENLRKTIDGRLENLQTSNEKKLEQMRNTVDEKLQSTLEKRLGESFKLVSERLEAVQRGLGEMQGLATGVDDLRRVLTNVKARGTWAEYQLGAILEQTLTPDQYERNVKMRVETDERVEFAIKLPGPDGDPRNPVWLPVDSKFPQEDYLRLLDASDRADAEGVRKAAEALEREAKNQAKQIRDKYINPPTTTDFAIMFLATEGLYAEILRRPGLVEELHNVTRVVLAGPATITAILSSLRLGFRTLAIEERAVEVWRVLAAVKTEFGKFGGVLDKVKHQLDSASKTIDRAGVRTRAMERKLRDVEQLPAETASDIFDLGEGEGSARQLGDPENFHKNGRSDARNAGDDKAKNAPGLFENGGDGVG